MPLPDPPPGLDVFLHEAVRRLVAGEALEPFCQWCHRKLTDLEDGDEEDDELRRRHRIMGRALWSAVPVPSHRWRARPLPKIDRNSPCHCGSGRKHKQCCRPLEAEAPPFSADGLLPLALSVADPSTLTADALRAAPPQALAMAAEHWNLQEDHGTTATVLAPLFESVARLDGRHEMAFDMLMDALQALGREQERHRLVALVAQAPDRDLATAARCRQVSMLADAGHDQEAWALFSQTRRAAPDNPQLWHLELTLLLAQGRDEEARLRAPQLVAQARRAGLDELAEVLQALGRDGLAGIADSLAEPMADDDALLQSWATIGRFAPEALDVEHVRALYRVQSEPDAEGGARIVRWQATGRLHQLEKAWHDRRRPDDHEDLLELEKDLGAMQELLARQPKLWLSMAVLRDLLLAGEQVQDELGGAGLDVTCRVASHAVRLLEALLPPGPARLAADTDECTAALRLLDLAITAAGEARDDAQVEHLVRRGLELAPDDPSGWRERLVARLLDQGRHAHALDWLGDADDLLPPLGHLRLLALYGAGRRQEAAQWLQVVHADFPHFARMLLPEVLDAPAGEDLPFLRLLGGEHMAWEHRCQVRPAWVRSGALGWLAGQDLDGIEREGRTLLPEHRERLAAEFHYPQLHGLLTAVGSAPLGVPRPRWGVASQAYFTGPADRLPPMREIERLHRHLRDRAAAAAADPGPLLDEIAQVTANDPDDLSRWIDGFLQGAGLADTGWRQAGCAVQSRRGPFAILRKLADGPVPLEPSAPGKQLEMLDGDPSAAWDAAAGALRQLWLAASLARPA